MTLSFLERVSYALIHTGWQTVTTFPVGWEPREYSLLYEGGLYYLFSTHPADVGTVMYSADTLEGLGGATPVTVSASSLWYPNAAFFHGTWYLFGTTGAGTVGYMTSDTTPPGSWSRITTLGTGFPDMDLNDPSVVATSIGGRTYWLLAGISTILGPAGRVVMKVYSHEDPPTDTGWALMEDTDTDVLANIGIPAWASVNSFDPNIYSIDGGYYLAFSGTDGANSSTGLVELEIRDAPPSSVYATGNIVVLSSDTTGGRWGDTNYMRGSDGIDRLFGVNGQELACLELPDPNPAQVNEFDARIELVGMASGAGDGVFAMAGGIGSGIFGMAASVGSNTSATGASGTVEDMA